MDCLPDEFPLVETPPEAYAKAEEMRQLMAQDLDEQILAKLVMEFDVGDFDLQLYTWPLLTWHEKITWRYYRQLWQDMETARTGMRPLNWRRK